MEEWVTLKVYTYPHEAYVLVSKLEFEGIACQLKDENTLLAHGFISTAIGGVKLQVKSSDYDDALLVLSVPGIEREFESPNTLVALLDRWSSRIPVINKLNFLPRVIGLGTLALTCCVSILLSLFYFSDPDGFTERTHGISVDREVLKKNHFFRHIWPVVDSLATNNPERAISLIDSI